MSGQKFTESIWQSYQVLWLQGGTANWPWVLWSEQHTNWISSLLHVQMYWAHKKKRKVIRCNLLITSDYEINTSHTYSSFFFEKLSNKLYMFIHVTDIQRRALKELSAPILFLQIFLLHSSTHIQMYINIYLSLLGFMSSLCWWCENAEMPSLFSTLFLFTFLAKLNLYFLKL